MYSAPILPNKKQLLPTFLLCVCVLPVSLAQESEQMHRQSGTATTVYKTVNPDGSISFSDQPAASSETLHVEPVPTVPSLSPEQINNAYTEQGETKAPTLSYYQNFTITAPADQSAFNSGSGDVGVVLEIYPGLSSSHEIELRMDNKLIKRGNQMQFTIPGVSRGTHTLQARILSASGQVLKETTSSFTLHRPSVLR